VENEVGYVCVCPGVWVWTRYACRRRKATWGMRLGCQKAEDKCPRGDVLFAVTLLPNTSWRPTVFSHQPSKNINFSALHRFPNWQFQLHQQAVHCAPHAGSHGTHCEEYYFLRCNAVNSGTSSQSLRSDVLPPSSGSKSKPGKQQPEWPSNYFLHSNYQ
jgi:hypothetical protein